MAAPAQSRTLTNRLFDWLFGRDFFISYRWSDGRDYAVKLAQRLKAEGFDCFLDSDGFIKGDDWRPTGDRELRKTSRLVLVGSPDIHSSEAVARELKIFGAKKGRLIAVEFGDALSHAKHPDSPVLANLDPYMIRQLEPLEALLQPPSEALIQELRRTFTVETTTARRRRVIHIVTGVLAVLFVLAVVLAFVANDQRQIAVAKQIEVSRNLASANWQLAEQARDNEADPIKAAHLFRLAAQAFEQAQELDQARNAALGANLAIEKSSLLRVFPNDQTTGMEVEMGESEGALLSKDQSRVLTWRGKLARLWQMNDETKEPLQTFEHEELQGAAFTEDGDKVLLWGGTCAQLCEIGPDATKPPQVFLAPKVDGSEDIQYVYGAALSKDGRHLLTWDDKSAWLWPTAAGNTEPPQRLPRSGSVAPAFTNDGNHVLTCISGGEGLGLAKLWKTGAASEEPQMSFSHRTTSGAFSAVISSDGARLLTWTEDGAALVWKVGPNQKEPLQTLPHEEPISGATFTKDGGRVLLWGEHASELWELGTGSKKPLQVLKHPMTTEFRISGVVFSKDERHLITWGGDTVCCWAAGGSDPMPLQTFKHHGFVYGAMISQDESRMLTWGGNGVDGSARLWAVGAGGSDEPLQILSHQGSINGAAYCQNDSRVLTWGNDGLSRLWEVHVGRRRLRKSFKHGEPVRGAVLDHDDNRLLTWSMDGMVRLWDTATNSQEQPLSLKHGDGVSGALFPQNRGNVLTWDGGGSARLWMIAPHGGSLLQTYAYPPDRGGADATQDGSRLLTWSGSSAQLWALQATGKEQLQTFEQEEPISGVAFDDNESRMLTWNNENGKVWKWSIGTGDMRPTKTSGSALQLDQLSKPMFSKDGNRLLALGRCTAQLWDFSGNAKLPRMTILHPEATDGAYFEGTCGAAFTSDDRRLLIWGGKTARLWSITEGGPKPLQSFNRNDYMKHALISRSGSRLLTWGLDDSVQMWAIGAGSKQPLQTFQHEALQDAAPEHEFWIGAAFSRDESHVLTWGQDGVARLWAIGDEPSIPASERVLELELCTGSTLYDGRDLKILSFDEWLEKRRQLEVLRSSRAVASP